MVENGRKIGWENLSLDKVYKGISKNLYLNGYESHEARFSQNKEIKISRIVNIMNFAAIGTG